MADLITRLRVLVGDPAGASEAFSDDALQDALDERRTDVVEAQLRYRPSFDETTLVTFHDFFAPWRNWEDSVVLRGPTGAVLTPDTSDLVAGHWTFTAGQASPVWITGSSFDLFGAAAAVCETWAATTAREFDVIFAGQEFFRSQKRKALIEVANAYWRRSVGIRPRPAWRSVAW